MRKVLVYAPHPDDEVIGVGGTIKRHTNSGDEVKVIIISEGVSAQYEDPQMRELRHKACLDAGEVLGVKNIEFHDVLDAQFDKAGVLEIAKIVTEELDKYSPNIVYAPHKSELHLDHRITYEAVLVATRPFRDTFHKGKVLFYETSMVRKSAFIPNYYTDITDTFEDKIRALYKYTSEIEKYPHPRSIESLKTMASYRGLEAGVQFAEGFVLGRRVW